MYSSLQNVCSSFVGRLSVFFFFLQIHWFSIFNSFMMVIFLTGLVSMILMRTLRNDYAKYAREDDDLESLVMFPQLLFDIAARYFTLVQHLLTSLFFEAVKPFLTSVLMPTGTGCK